MPSLEVLSRKPADVAAEEHHAAWFQTLCTHLLNNCICIVAGVPYRFAELEAYYHGPTHPDLFAHRQPIQLERGRWYFHRAREAYRGGSFKGLDITFGDGTAHFGILIRSIAAPDGTIIDGPSLTVDHLVARSGCATVAELDARIDAREIWDASSPLFITAAKQAAPDTVYQTARVGLSLKTAKGKPDAPRFIGMPYRFLTAPRAISKGKPQMVLALNCSGHTPEAIRGITGVPPPAIARYIADFSAGQQLNQFDSYIGKPLSTGGLCQLLGTWTAMYGKLSGASSSGDHGLMLVDPPRMKK